MSVIDTPDRIRVFRLIALKHAFRLEQLGMRRSRGPSARKMLCVESGLPPRTPAATILEEISALIEREKREMS